MTMCSGIRNETVVEPMIGIFDTVAELTQDRQGLSYVKAKGTSDNPLFPGQEIRGHEFHYSRLNPTPEGRYVYDVTRGTGIDGSHDGLQKGRSIGTYMHQHALATKNWGTAIVNEAGRQG